MSGVSLTLACADFIDRTRAILDGPVGVAGCSVTAVPISPTDVFTRVWRHKEFDCAEISLGLFISMVGHGNDEFIGIPAFTQRSFAARHIFINRHSGVGDAKDLEGKRIGIPGFHTTGSIWIRGFLQDALGVDESEIQWVTGGQSNIFHSERPPYLEIPDSQAVEVIPPGSDLIEMLEKGAIDAWIGLADPTAGKQETAVRRLFDDGRDVDIEYARTVGGIPLLHLIVLRREKYDRYPWLARNVFEAFKTAKTKGHEMLTRGGIPVVLLPWLDLHFRELNSVCGGDDYFPYGYKANSRLLHTLLEYAAQQGLVSGQLALEDILAPETLDL